jgi:long-subunit acyl-CoA synthetase (AMP-forming)
MTATGKEPKRTLMDVLDATAKAHASHPALKVKHGGKWETTTWKQYRDQVRLAARGFIKLGLQPKHGVSIIGFNSPQWAIANMAGIYGGGTPVGIYTTNTPQQCKYIAGHSDSNIAVVENQDQLAKFLEIRDQLPLLRAIVLMEGTSEDEKVHSWKELLEFGESLPEEQLEERISAQDPDDVCELIYTSGTTGDPKGVMLTHDNLTWTAHAISDEIGGKTDDVLISYLPFSHIAEQITSLHSPLISGATTQFAESLEKLGDNLREVRPSLLVAVPRVWEKIQGKMVEAGKKNSPLKKKIAAWARGVGLAAGYAEQEGASKGLFYGLADKLVFSKVRERLGLDRSRMQITSAAPISRDTLEFFMSLGVPICEIYGMSECTGPATVSLPNEYRTGWVGRALSGTEIKIAEDGEICMRGRHVFKGYYKNEAATKETIDADGWLHSGDIGEIDDKGLLKITDRKKDIIITAGGENIAPQLIEGLLKGIPAVSQAVVIGDRRKHLSALLTLDETQLNDAIAAAGSGASTMVDASEDPKLQDWLFKQVEDVNIRLAKVQRVKKIKILPADLSIDGGELTPTMKVKRKVVNEKYKDAIEAFYA